MHALLDSFISSIRPFIHLIHCIRSFSSIHICQLTSFHLTNNSYKQTGSYSHVLFLKLPTRRVPGTTWYEFIWILFSRQPHSKNCSQLGLFMIKWPGFGYFRPSARPILMFQRTKVRYGSTFFWQTCFFAHSKHPFRCSPSLTQPAVTTCARAGQLAQMAQDVTFRPGDHGDDRCENRWWRLWLCY